MESDKSRYNLDEGAKESNGTCSPKSVRAEVKLTGSATGTVRNKVALKPGHSLLDWIKLGHSGKDLTGVGGKYITVTPDELAKHNKRNDAWIALKGQVYNVSHYFDFHPGGSEELLKGVGMDATRLFNEVHAWVNVESMLQKCLVGRLKASISDVKASRPREGLGNLLFSKLKKNENPVTKSLDPGKPEGYKPDKSLGLPMPLFDWFQKPDSFILLLYTRRPGIGDSSPNIRVILKQDSQVEVKVRVVKRGILCHCMLLLSLKAPVAWPCSLTLIADIGKVEVVFQKKSHEIWQNIKHLEMLGPEEMKIKPNAEFHKKWLLNAKGTEEKKEDWTWEVENVYQPLEVMNILTVNHDTKLFILKHKNNICDFIPIGHHVQVQAKIQGMVIERYYTPVVPSLHSYFWPSSVPSKGKSNGPLPPETEGQWLFLLIKSTEGGALSPWLCNGGLNIGDTLNVSECIAPTIPDQGHVVPPPFHMGRSPLLRSSSQDALHLLLLAAGTGLTPMVRIILWGLQLSPSQCKKITLIFFNKTEEDIVWRDQMNKLMEDCDRFIAIHVLSNADVGWNSETGIIRHELLEPYLLPEQSTSAPIKPSNVYTCICGPTPFTKAAEKILLDLNVKAKDYFTFLAHRTAVDRDQLKYLFAV